MLFYYLNLLLPLPPFVACFWAMKMLRNESARERKILMVTFLILICIYFFIQNLTVEKGHYPFWGAKFLHDLSATFLVPIAYVFLRKSMALTSGRYVPHTLLFLLLLMVPDACMQLAIPFGSPLPAADTQYSYLHLQFGPHLTVKQSLYVLVIVFQVCVVITRLMKLREVFVQRDLYLSEKGHKLVRGCLVGCGWIILSLLPSQQWLKEAGFMFCINAGYSFLVTFVIVMIVKYFDKTIVVNSDNEPVNIEDDMDSDLAEALRLAIERDKVYLNYQLRIEDVARLLSSNRTYVTRVCRKKFDMTFTELMNHHRVEHSKHILLEDPHKRMEDVAAESGFSSASFFAKVFKLREGRSPTQWRQIHLAKQVDEEE